MRRLIEIPIIHTQEDLGSQQDRVRRAYIAIFGEWKWRKHLEAITALWDRIEKEMLSLALDYHKVKLYQDGLPECGRELAIVEEIAKGGSRNHRLLLMLIERGATLVGTEEIALLMEERQRLLEAGEAPSAGGHDDLMRRRDAYIARRIDATLGEDEVGLLFIGALHRVALHLPADIHVERPLVRAGEGQTAGRGGA